MGEHLQAILSNEVTRLNTDLLDQSLVKIRHCLGQLNEDQIGWRPEASMNSIGNLLLHLGQDIRAAVAGLKVARPRIDGVQVRTYEGIKLG